MGKKSSSEKLVIAAASAGAAVGAAYLAVGNAIFNKTMSKKSIAKKMDEKKNEYDGITKEGMKWYDSASPAKVKIVTPRGGYVHGEIILADEPSDVWVIVIHGYTGSPRRMGSFGKRFHEMGYNCLFPYLCGHGASESNYVTMGWNDRIDIKAWIDYIINENANAKIVLFGLSMGAATVMMTTGEPLESNVVCAIEDCGYTSVWDECRANMKDAYGLPTFPFLSAARSATMLRAGYDMKKASCIERSRAPSRRPCSSMATRTTLSRSGCRSASTAPPRATKRSWLSPAHRTQRPRPSTPKNIGQQLISLSKSIFDNN